MDNKGHRQHRKSLTRALLLVMATAVRSVAAADLPPSMVTIERYVAERGDADGEYFMGEHHEFGDSGLEKDLTKALEWYDKAARQNHPAAQYKMGVFHEQGLAGLPKQLDTAKEWYRRSAQQGYRQAEQRLAELKAADAEARRQEQQSKAEAIVRQERQRKADAAKNRAREVPASTRAAPEVAVPVVAPVAAPTVPGLAASQVLVHMLSSRWYEDAMPAEFLPTEDMSCLKTGDSEITCFSKERTRVIADTEATFVLKAVLHDFTDHAFDVRYIYHVSQIRGTARKDDVSDDYGLRLTEGWQQPGQSTRCRFKEPERVVCRGTRSRLREYAAR